MTHHHVHASFKRFNPHTCVPFPVACISQNIYRGYSYSLNKWNDLGCTKTSIKNIQHNCSTYSQIDNCAPEFQLSRYHRSMNAFFRFKNCSSILTNTSLFVHSNIQSVHFGQCYLDGSLNAMNVILNPKFDNVIDFVSGKDLRYYSTSYAPSSSVQKPSKRRTSRSRKLGLRLGNSRMMNRKYENISNQESQHEEKFMEDESINERHEGTNHSSSIGTPNRRQKSRSHENYLESFRSIANQNIELKFDDNQQLKMENQNRDVTFKKMMKNGKNVLKTRVLGLENTKSIEPIENTESIETNHIQDNNNPRKGFFRQNRSVRINGRNISKTEITDDAKKFVVDTFFAPRKVATPVSKNENIDENHNHVVQKDISQNYSKSKLSLLSYARLVDMTDYIIKSRMNLSEGNSRQTNERAPITTFKDELMPGVYEYLVENKIETFTDIQTKSLATAMKKLKSKKPATSVLLASQTGTGKTLAYLLPLVNNIKNDEVYAGIGIQAYRPRALILVPSKQLASQVCRVAKSISHKAKFRTAIFRSDFKTRRMRVDAEDADIIVSTPGIWNHMVEKGYTHYTDLKYVVVDEADSMLDEKSFGKETSNILKEIRNRKADIQYIFAMATVNHSILDWTAEYSPNAKVLASASIHRPVPSVSHSFIDCSHIDKLKDCLLPLLKKEEEPTIVFCNTVSSARAVNLFLMENDIFTANFHAEIRPKEQHEEFEKFRNGIVPVLVTTDIASRGLDLTFVKHVINFDFPKNHVDYIHRIGRTGRMGAAGHVTSLLKKQDKGLAESIKRTVLDEKRLDFIKNRLVEKSKKNTNLKRAFPFKRSSVVAKRIIQKTNAPPEPW